MKNITGIAVFIVLGLFMIFLCIAAYIEIKEYNGHNEQKPALTMELVCSTPHGHKVYKYNDGHAVIYVLIRHEDGYPINISVK